MRLRATTIFFAILFSSCIDIIPSESMPIVKDFYLKWSWEKRQQSILLSKDISTGGLVPVDETVYAIAYNEDFILAKRYQNKQKLIADRLFRRFKGGVDPNEVYPLEIPTDSIYLHKSDSVFKKEEDYFFLSSGDYPSRHIPDSLFPYVKKTYYYIIDIRNYDFNNWFERNILFQFPKFDGYEVFEFENEVDFLRKRIELDVPNSLKFTEVYEKK